MYYQGYQAGSDGCKWISPSVCETKLGKRGSYTCYARNFFEADETDAALLIDASNAFNSLNRAAALHNVRVICPAIAIYAINTYRAPARLFVVGGKELESSEGTTQGDPLAMSLYAVSLQPLITRLTIASSVKQCWLADDATGFGSLDGLKKWCGMSWRKAVQG